MISKELLSIVFGKNIDKVYYHIEDNMFEYWDEHNIELGDGTGIWIDLSLDTLGRLCKEFILKHNYFYETGILDIPDEDNYFCVVDNGRIANTGRKVLYSYSELEAVIKSTEFVAKEKGLLY